MRLDKFLSSVGYSRKEANKLIQSGVVSVNNKITTKKDEKINENLDIILVNDKQIVYKKYTYIMLNKPLNVVSASFDKKEKTVLDLLDINLKKLNLFCVGRLDKETTGLIFLTNDGEFCHKLTNPKSEKEKKYYFELIQEISNEDIEKLQKGVVLKDGLNTKPCKIDMINNSSGYITITEGKYHQVRRMFASVSNKVIKLNRVMIAGIELDKNLALGQYRELTNEELELLNDI